MIPYVILAIEDESDRAFMAELYLNYHKLMYREIIQIVRDTWAADDILQTTLEKLIDKVQELRNKDRDRLVNYIITACKNTSFNYLREKGRHPEFPFEEWGDLEGYENDGNAVDTGLMHECDLNSLAHIWPKLSARNRYLLEGRYILQKPLDEMAKELDIKPESLRMALTRAKISALRLMEEENFIH